MAAVIAEVCVDSVAGALAALHGGADRVELCAALEIGGLTPSTGLIRSAGYLLTTHVLIRPRPGDFCYIPSEVRVMMTDVEQVAEDDVAAVVVGALTAEGDIDMPTMTRLQHSAHGVTMTFHHAFDLVREPLRALDQLKELGIGRVQTSGGRRTAIEGAEAIARLVAAAGDDIVVVPGGGITPENAAEVIRLTGARELHLTARRTSAAPVSYRASEIRIGALFDEEYVRHETSVESIRGVIAALD